MISDLQKEELDAFSYLYTEEEIQILSEDPVHLQIKASSSMEEGMSPIHALLDLEWGENYPDELPRISIISIDLSKEEKEGMIESLQKTCDDYMGMAMTYVLSSALNTLLTDHHKGVTSRITTHSATSNADKAESSTTQTDSTEENTNKQKTKAQKRHEQNNWVKAGELPRGYNWVDVMNHLRKTASE